MKDIIVIIGTIVLGLIIFSMIVGDKDSIKTAGEEAMKKTVEAYRLE